MAVTCEDFRIDIAHEQSFKYLQAKQYDHNSRKRRLIITDSNIPITYSENRTEYITLSLSLGNDNYSNTSCPFGEDGYPYITFTDSMLSKAGDISCELRIYDSKGGTIITTFTFMMTVSKSLLNHDRLVESSEFDILNNLILQALELPDLIEEIKEQKEIIDGYLEDIKSDIDSYRKEFTELSNEAKALIDDVEEFLETVTSAEAERVKAENDRVSAETARVNAEKNRASAESARASAETNRVNAEKSRVTAESARASAENERKSNEEDRVDAESARASAETARKNAETARVNAETARKNAETARANAETGRVNAEADRVEAEEARQSAFDGKIEDVNEAITNVEQVTQETQAALEEIQEAMDGLLDEGFLLTSTQTRVLDAILLATGWTGSGPYTQTVSVSGMRASYSPLITCVADVETQAEMKMIQKEWNYVNDIVVGDNQITATCYFNKPGRDLYLKIKGV